MNQLRRNFCIGKNRKRVWEGRQSVVLCLVVIRRWLISWFGRLFFLYKLLKKWKKWTGCSFLGSRWMGVGEKNHIEKKAKRPWEGRQSVVSCLVVIRRWLISWFDHAFFLYKLLKKWKKWTGCSFLGCFFGHFFDIENANETVIKRLHIEANPLRKGLRQL